MTTTLSPAQFELVDDLLSLTLAAMAAAGVFFFASRPRVAPHLRPALVISRIVSFYQTERAKSDAEGFRAASDLRAA